LSPTSSQSSISSSSLYCQSRDGSPPTISSYPSPSSTSSSSIIGSVDASGKRIPRPCNRFILFRRAWYQTYGLKFKESGADLSKAAGRAWRLLSDQEKLFWTARAEEEKREHQRKYPGYKYQPRRPTHSAESSPKLRSNVVQHVVSASEPVWDALLQLEPTPKQEEDVSVAFDFSSCNWLAAPSPTPIEPSASPALSSTQDQVWVPDYTTTYTSPRVTPSSNSPWLHSASVAPVTLVTDYSQSGSTYDWVGQVQSTTSVRSLISLAQSSSTYHHYTSSGIAADQVCSVPAVPTWTSAVPHSADLSMISVDGYQLSVVPVCNIDPCSTYPNAELYQSFAGCSLGYSYSNPSYWS
jgi:hypothetical protein